ncbi:helix-turn-helix domain-containing protein [Calothrix rhizosoleniae]|uniref:helix-turn-helix domain-containing protein n=1 Tax=Calothrix rhizosoleniae TaxID=888997 RepID=UPI000B49A7C9|nr:RodZ domain-containing protein [Calothrix rhizosoleniae]
MKALHKAQHEQLQEIVDKLIQARKEQSFSIEEMAMKTLIRPALLQALEEGRFEDLPEPIFVQGFILRYGDALGLNGSSLAEQFIQISDPPELKEVTPEVEPKTNIYIPIFFPYIVLVVFASIVLFYILNSSKKVETISQSTNSKQISKVQKKPQQPVPSPSVSIPITQASPTPSVTPSTTPSATPSPTPKQVKVTLELQGKSWLRVIADGKKVFQGTLNKGARKTWTAKKSLRIRSGNAGAVLFSTNKQKAKVLGKEGAVKDLELIPESEGVRE